MVAEQFIQDIATSMRFKPKDVAVSDWVMTFLLNHWQEEHGRLIETEYDCTGREDLVPVTLNKVIDDFWQYPN